MALIYCKKTGRTDDLKKLEKVAEGLLRDGMEEYWLFVYECLGERKLRGEWKTLKNENVSFLSVEY